MKNKQPWVACSVILIIAALAAALFWAGEDELPATVVTPELDSAAAKPAQQLEGVVLEGVDDKGGRWKVNAQTAQADAEGSVGVLNDVTFELIGESGELRANAKTCSIDSDSSLELSGGANIEWDQWQAQMQRAVYDFATQSVNAGPDVTVTGEALRVSGQTLTLDLENNVATMGGGVKAVFEGNTK